MLLIYVDSENVTWFGIGNERSIFLTSVLVSMGGGIVERVGLNTNCILHYNFI